MKGLVRLLDLRDINGRMHYVILKKTVWMDHRRWMFRRPT